MIPSNCPQIMHNSQIQYPYTHIYTQLSARTSLTSVYRSPNHNRSLTTSLTRLKPLPREPHNLRSKQTLSTRRCRRHRRRRRAPTLRISDNHIVYRCYLSVERVPLRVDVGERVVRRAVAEIARVGFSEETACELTFGDS